MNGDYNAPLKSMLKKIKYDKKTKYLPRKKAEATL